MNSVTMTLIAAGFLAAGSALSGRGSSAVTQERSIVLRRLSAFQDTDRAIIENTLDSIGLNVYAIESYYIGKFKSNPQPGWTNNQLAAWISEVEHDEVIRMLPWLKVVMERGELRSLSTGLRPKDSNLSVTFDRFGKFKDGNYSLFLAINRFGPRFDAIYEWNGAINSQVYLIVPFLQEVTDWAVATRPKTLFSMTYRQAAEAAWRWHQDRRIRKKREISEVKMHVVWRWSDGWFVTKIDSANAVDAQGEQMDHCIADVFKAKILSKKTNAFSVRDTGCRPVVTIEIANDGTVRQARGRGNSDPKPTYASYTFDFLKRSGIADLERTSGDLEIVQRVASPVRSPGRAVDEFVTCEVRMEDLAKSQRVIQDYPYSDQATEALKEAIRTGMRRQIAAIGQPRPPRVRAAK